VERISELTGGKKVDLCFEVIGLKQTFEQAVMAVRDG
jgi:threonine dehydrogenase-like Zn-dependent dehydrogenase